MLKGKNIICFGSERWEYPGLQQTIMRLLARENRIIYVNAIGSRKLVFRISNIRTYIDRFLRIFESTKTTSDDVIVCNPWIVPIVYSRPISLLNKQLISFQFSRLLMKSGFNEYILWLGSPSAAFLVDFFDPELLVYNPVDRYFAFPFVDREKVLCYEKQIAEKSDAIICTSEAIRDDLLKYNKRAQTVTHGVDVEHFRSALDSNEIPSDLKDISKPIIGYFGGLSHRVNLSLLKKISIRHPDANIVLIGKRLCDLSEVEGCSNIHVLGYKDYGALPSYLMQFSVCLIPYYVNELMEGVDPIKIREYLCLGKPVVSVDLPEIRKLEGVVYIGRNEEDFIAKVGEALREEAAPVVNERIRIARQSDWSIKIGEVSDIVHEALVQKGGGGSNLQVHH